MFIKTLIVLAACVGLSTSNAYADGPYPNRVIRIIVPFAPGGGSDIIARLMAQKLTASLGQPVVVENKPGAAGAVGSTEAARSPPDGYTLVLGTASSHGLSKWIYDRLSYDPQSDFAPVSLLATTDYALAVPASSEFKSVADLVKAAKQRDLNYGSSGPGSVGQVAAEMLANRAGVHLTHIPYRGAAQAINDLIAGRIDLMFDNTNVLAPFAKSGQLRILAVTGAVRSQALPDVPTIIESGMPGFTFFGWWALFAPAKTPAPIITRLNKEAVAVLNTAEVTNFLLTNGNTPTPMSAPQTAKFVAEQLTLFKGIVQSANIKAE